MGKKYIFSVSAILLGLWGGITSAQSRDQIQVAGSSTVLPYAKIVAEIFGETYPQFKHRLLSPAVQVPVSKNFVVG